MSAGIELAPDDLGTPPPAFSKAELARRRYELASVAAAAGADVVVAYGAHRTGSAVPWLTTWPVTREAVAVLAEGRCELLVGFDNHVPNARAVVEAAGMGDGVGALGDDAPATVVDMVARIAPGRRGVGLVGGVPPRVRAALDGWAERVVDLDQNYTRLRLVKSEEELRWVEHAAALTDHAAAALVDAASAGASEQEMVAAAEHAYRPSGGSHHIAYVSTSAMERPDRCVPAQWPTGRRVQAGSAVVFELSAGWGPDYPAQLLRTVAVGSAPTPLYAHLHEVAEQIRDEVLARVRAGADPRDLVAALDRLRSDRLTAVDHLVHGLGGGYLPPVLGEGASPRGMHAEPLCAGMTLVVQPNICTPDLRAGVQTGEMVVVTEDGYRLIHRFPPGLLSVPYRPKPSQTR